MGTTNRPGGDDLFGLRRFLTAQGDDHERIMAEIRSGRKRSHWMWYIFPQYVGLGFSIMAERYAIKSLEEARAYLKHPILGPRLIACTEAVLAVEGRSASEIFGYPDVMKLKSSATLFAQVAPADSVFEQLLIKYYKGERDTKTLRLLGVSQKGKPND